MGDLSLLRWRTGRSVGRTVYAQAGPEPSGDDVLIGTLDTPALAAEAVAAHNVARAARLSGPAGYDEQRLAEAREIIAEIEALKAERDALTEGPS